MYIAASTSRLQPHTFSLAHNGSTRSSSQSCCAFGSKIGRMQHRSSTCSTSSNGTTPTTCPNGESFVKIAETCPTTPCVGKNHRQFGEHIRSSASCQRRTSRRGMANFLQKSDFDTSRLWSFPPSTINNSTENITFGMDVTNIDENQTDKDAIQAQCPIVCFKASTVLQSMWIMLREPSYQAQMYKEASENGLQHQTLRQFLPSTMRTRSTSTSPATPCNIRFALRPKQKRIEVFKSCQVLVQAIMDQGKLELGGQLSRQWRTGSLQCPCEKVQGEEGDQSTTAQQTPTRHLCPCETLKMPTST